MVALLFLVEVTYSRISEHASGGSKILLNSRPLERCRMLFWQVGQTLNSSVISSQRMETRPD